MKFYCIQYFYLIFLLTHHNCIASSIKLTTKHENPIKSSLNESIQITNSKSLRNTQAKSNTSNKSTDTITNKRKQNADNPEVLVLKGVEQQGVESIPEVLTLKGITLDGTHSIDYYYPYFIRNHILKFDDDETQDTHLMDTNCKDENCKLCIPDRWDKCYQCKIGFLKLHAKCYKYCPDGFQADIVRRRCYPKINTGKNYYY